MIDGQRIHRVIGKESEGVTRQHVEDAIEKLRTDARVGRLSLPKKTKNCIGFFGGGRKISLPARRRGWQGSTFKKISIQIEFSAIFKECSFI